MSSTPSASPDPPRDALASLKINRAPETHTASGGVWKWLFLILLLSLVGWFGFQAYQQREGLSDQTNWMQDVLKKRIEVQLKSITIQKGRSADAVVVATGYLGSRRQARIGARAAGRIARLNFEEGNRVKQGEILAELEHKDLEASLSASKASVARAQAALEEQTILIEQAKVDYKRAERLWKAQSFSKFEYDQAKYTYRSAIARRNSLKAELSLASAQKSQAEQLKENMFIRAPFDGTVISKDAEVGESILPGGMGGGSGRGSVATVADLENLEIECDVQEDFISRVTEAQEADIAVDAVPDKKYHGTVRKIIPMGDRARATIKVKVVISDADALLFPEMAGTVYFLPTEKELTVDDSPRMFSPDSAITTDDDGNSFVWVVDSEKRAKKIAVKTGESRDGRTEIIEGLTGRERVVISPDELSDGTPVQISE